MRVDEVRSRRTFLAQLGKGTGALVLLGLAACVPATSSSSGGPATASAPPDPTDVSLDPVDGSLDPIESDPGDEDVATPVAEGAVRWNRVNLGFVSAYILVRDGAAAVVDTGVEGSEDDIENALTAIGLEWGAVQHVILTHRHPDHAGSVAAVLDRAREAQGYAGAEDLPSIAAPRELRVAADGDDVFGLRIVTTPGHTKGHISVLDAIGGVLVAGDALNTANGKATGPNPDFSEDMKAANASVAKLAQLRFDTLLVGHGDPVEGDAQASVAALVS
jgi:glyoxylase-like metal-dependent hydrolase (beta-lactamase superfamily II)